MITSSADIRGFCNFDDLYEEYVSQAEGGETFVEIGSLFGRSTAAMAESIRDSGKKIDFYSVDVWDLRGITTGQWSTEDIQYAQTLGLPVSDDLTYQCTFTALEMLELIDFVTLLQMPSQEAAKLFDDATVNFCFIDGDHSYTGVQKDIAAWLPKIPVGGILAGHDYDWPEVRQAVDEIFPHVETFNTSWIVPII